MQVLSHTRPEGHFKVWAANQLFFFGLLPPTPRAETGLPVHSPYGCWLGYHPPEARLVDQKALPPYLHVHVCSFTWLSVLLKDTCFHGWNWNPHSSDQKHIFLLKDL